MIDGIAVQNYQLEINSGKWTMFRNERIKWLIKYLKGSGKLKNPLDLGLNFRQTTAPARGSFHDRSF